MFWRNPTAAFFNFLLPLLFLAPVRRDLLRRPEDAQRHRAGHRRHERHVDDVHRAGHQHHLPARAGRAQAHPRHAAAAGSYLGGVTANAVTNAAVQIVDHRAGGQAASSASAGRKDWLELAVFAVAGVVCFAALGVAFSHVDPQLRRRAGLRERRLPAGDLHLRRLLRRRHRPAVPARRRPGAPAQAHHRRRSRRRWSPASPWPTTWANLAVIVAWGIFGAFFAVRGFSWQAKRD